MESFLLAVEKTTVIALMYFLVNSPDVSFELLTHSQARSSDQTDSTGKPTSDVIKNLGAAVRNLEDVFVRVAVEGSNHVSGTQ